MSKKKLGIYVTSDLHMDKLSKLVKAAHAKDVEVTVFFTHVGACLTCDPQTAELAKIAKLSVCNVGFEDNKLNKENSCILESDYATQARHGEMIDEVDRYVTF